MKTQAGGAPVEVEYLPDLSDADKARADALLKHMQGQLASQQFARRQQETDPSTRPEFVVPETKGGSTPSDSVVLRKGYLPPFTGLMPHERKSAYEGINVNTLFPQGDIDNYSATRWAMAVQRSRESNEGTTAFHKWAPWEAHYYDGLFKLQDKMGVSKAGPGQGDMATGQAGGFLAPEELN